MTVSSVSGTSYASYYSSSYSSSSAAESPAEVGIDERTEAQATGYSTGADNMASAQDLLNVSDSALASISDYLQRIRELAVQASSDLLSESDLAAIQAEIEQNLQGIADISSNTTYNTQNLLDGSTEEYQIATDGSGNATTVTTTNATLDALGLTGFDVTGDYDISTIDSAIELVTKARAEGGAQSNTLSYAQDLATMQASYLQAKADDEELNKMIEEYQERKKEQALQQYRIQMQRKQQQAQQVAVTNLFV